MGWSPHSRFLTLSVSGCWGQTGWCRVGVSCLSAGWGTPPCPPRTAGVGEGEEVVFLKAMFTYSLKHS